MPHVPPQPGHTGSKRSRWQRYLPPVVTAVIFLLIFQRIPFWKFLEALRLADYPRFLLLMLPNSLFYFAWDTFVLALVMQWFHGPIRYRELLPVRAVTYVVSFLNTNLARGATAFYLTRKLQLPFFPIAGTVIFLTALELTHLSMWAAAGMFLLPDNVPGLLPWIPALVGAFWLVFLPYMRRDVAPWRGIMSYLTRLIPGRSGWGRIRDWALFRTFAQASGKRYVQVILLRAPMFAVALVIHFFAVRAFGMEIPFDRLLAILPIIFMLAALPITVAHLGTTQAAWIFFFHDYAGEAQLLAYSFASHLAFMMARALLGVFFLPRAYRELFGPIPLGEFFLARTPNCRGQS